MSTAGHGQMVSNNVDGDERNMVKEVKSEVAGVLNVSKMPIGRLLVEEECCWCRVAKRREMDVV